MKFSIVLSTHAAQFEAATFKGDLDANLARIAALGYDGVELAIRDPKVVNGDALLALVRRHGLEVSAIGTGQAWGEERLSFTDPDPQVRQAAIQRIKEHLPFAAQADAVVIIGLIRGIVKPEVSHEQAMAWLVEALQECSAASAPLGVRLALEPINRYETTLINTVAQGLELIERVGADNFGLLLDTFHMNIEEPSIEDSIRQAGERIFHFHVADSNRWYPGAGHLNFARILDVLQSLSYAGYVSGEFLPLPDADTAARRAIAFLRAVQKGQGGRIMINTRNHPDRHKEDIPVGKAVAFCRCWQSEKFPYCDGTHRRVNAETGDNVGPVVVTAVSEGPVSS